MGRNTVRRYGEALAEEGYLEGPVDDLPELALLKDAVLRRMPVPAAPAQTRSSVEDWAEVIGKMLQRGAEPQGIFDTLRTRHEGFTGSLSAVKRLCLRLRKDRGPRAEDVVIPVETAPGNVAQVDFGEIGRFPDPVTGKPRKAYVFVMVLGYSRHQYADIVFDQTVETWLRLHEQAFRFFGGVPATMVPDNLKSAVVRAAFDADIGTGLNRSYRELARHYGFKVDPTPVRQPEKKGKVESGVKYVKGNFFRPRDLQTVEQARQELKQWVEAVAGQRLHPSTGCKPLVLFEEEERPLLLPLPSSAMTWVVWKEAVVHRDSHVQFEKRLYSVPWKHIGKRAWVRASGSLVDVYVEETKVATHNRRGRGMRETSDSHLPEYRVEYRHRERGYWEQKADQLGPDVGTFIRHVFDSDDVLLKLRTVQGMLALLPQYPADRANAASRRADHFGNYTLRGLKGILNQALDLQPLPQDLLSRTKTESHQYARLPSELLLKERTCIQTTN